MNANKKSLYLGCITLSALVFLFGPLQSYIPQPEEFRISLRDTLLFSFLFFLLTIGVFTSIVKYSRQVGIIICTLSIAVFAQQYFMIWKYGTLGTQVIQWSSYFYGLIDSPIWILCLFFGWKYQEQILKSYHKISIGIITYATFTLLITLQQNYSHHSYIGIHPREDNVEISNTFSKDKNIILFVLDGFQGNTFQELIDENKDLKSLFTGFTFYRNATSRYGFTQQSIANVLSGESWDGNQPFDDFPQTLVSKRSMPNELKKKDVVVQLAQENLLFQIEDPDEKLPRPKTQPIAWFKHKSAQMAYIYDFSLFKSVPHYFKKFVLNDGSWLFSNQSTRFSQNEESLKKLVRIQNEKDLHAIKAHGRTNDIYFLNSLDFPTKVIEKRMFKYHHLLGPHFPLVMNENLEMHEVIYDTEFNKVKPLYNKQAHAYLKLVSNTLFKKLKIAGLWDNTMIILIGDHGGSLSGISKSTQTGAFPYPSDKAQGNPLFIVKPFGATEPLKYSNAPVALGDIPKTVLSSFGINAEGFQGMNIFSIPEDLKRKRFFTTVNFEEKEGPKKLSLHGYHPIYEYEIDGSVWDDRSWKVSKIIR